MSFRVLVVALFSFTLVLWSCSDDKKKDTPDAGEDSGPDTDTDADVAPYDFEAQAPWYLCPEEEFPEGATIVTAFDQTYQYFGDEDKRTVESIVDFPEPADWAQVGMWFNLECPESGLCDHWDRAGSVQLVLNPQDDPGEWQQIELFRHMTPYKIEMCQYIDVTPMADLLTGQQTLTSFIDTWVGPGHSNGEGWRVSVNFVFYPGANEGADEIINIWGRRNINVGDTDPAANVDSQIDPVTVSIPADATKVEAHITATGHGFGFTSNCAEFCQMRQDVMVNGTVHSVNPWRDDCAQNPISPQYGTWEYNRNGWCPGAIQIGDNIDITDSINVGADNTIDFDILMSDGTEYDNISTADGTPYEIIALRLYVYK